MVSVCIEPRGNHLLAGMPAASMRLWQPHLEPIEMAQGMVLGEANLPMTHVYFPISAIVSLLYVTRNGAATEIAVIGNEGVVGFAAFMGGESTLSRAVVNNAGYGFRLKAQHLKHEFDHEGAVMQLVLRHTQALITQMAQTAVCNRHHAIVQQLCRWLLLRLDRVRGNELVVTHELVATLLGVRREGVTEVAAKLQMEGIIRYSRGRVIVLNRAGLERHACECYAAIKLENDRLLAPLQPV